MDELRDAKLYGSKITTTPESISIEHGRMRRLGGSTAGATIPFEQITQINDKKPTATQNGSYEIISEGYAPGGQGRPQEVIYLRKHRAVIEQLSKLIEDRSGTTTPADASDNPSPIPFSSHRTPDAPLPFNGWRIDGRKLRGDGQEFDLAGAQVEFEAGANAGSRITATRVVTGGVLFGPIGAVAGGLLRKNRNKVYIVITFADGSSGLIEAPAKKETQARKFANHLQSVANRLS